MLAAPRLRLGRLAPSWRPRFSQHRSDGTSDQKRHRSSRRSAHHRPLDTLQGGASL